MDSQCMHGAKFLAITNNTNTYAGVRQFADGSKIAVMCLCTQAASVVKISLCMHASILAHRVRGASMSQDDCDNVRR